MDDYERYYRHQTGGNFFRGARIQRGYGLGNILGGLFRSALPILKKGAKALGKQALQTGVEIASDALSGQNVKTSANQRLRQAGLQMTSLASRQLSKKRKTPPSKNNRLKRKTPSVPHIKTSSKPKKRTLDIFDY